MSGLYTYRPDLVVLALGSESLENLPQGPREISHVEHALNAQLKDMLGIWTCLTQNLGVPVLLGASRKRFIGTIGAEAEAARRMPGSLAVALAGVAQGMQMIRVHDVAETRQALRLWQAATRGY